jgi:hypothetical protein
MGRMSEENRENRVVKSKMEKERGKRETVV